MLSIKNVYMFDFLKCGSGEGGRAHPLGRESARSTSTYSTVQCGKVQSKTVCYCKVQDIIVQYTTEQYGAVQKIEYSAPGDSISHIHKLVPTVQ